ncbi:MAG: hypothetical protein HQL23_00180 [Candidatus Omnitrophica bacterium]|nr:hypothetical protein [Candidatus Omnitrophota bacterium]
MNQISGLDRNFSAGALARLRQIHALSQRRNTAAGKPHQEKLLEMIWHHAEEIRELQSKGDAHFLAETGDLFVLCMELLIENGASPDEMLELAFSRFEKKLR